MMAARVGAAAAFRSCGRTASRRSCDARLRGICSRCSLDADVVAPPDSSSLDVVAGASVRPVSYSVVSSTGACTEDLSSGVDLRPFSALTITVAPDRGGKGAAGHALHRRGIVVADPHARHIVGGEADEPGVVIVLRRAGLARGLVAGNGGAACRCRASRRRRAWRRGPCSHGSATMRCGSGGWRL